MTDDSAHDQLGGFRTPLAAAMLSGVVAGVFSIAKLQTGWEARFGWSAISSLLFLPQNILFCSGPGICRRSVSLALRGLPWAVALTLLDGVLHAILMLSLTGYMYRAPFTTYFVVYGIESAAVAGLLGHALTRLYGIRPYSLRAAVCGALCGVCLFAAATAARYASTRGTWAMTSFPETATVEVMLRLINNIILVVVPTWAIEHTMRRQAALAKGGDERR